MTYSRNQSGIARESVGPYACVGVRATRRVRDRRQETGDRNSRLAVSWGVSIKACIRRTGCLGPDSRAIETASNADATSTPTASMHALREIGGGLDD